MRKWLWVTAVLALLLVIGLLAWGGIYFFNIAVARAPKPFLRQDPAVDAQDAAWSQGREDAQDWLAGQKVQLLEITAADGLKLSGMYISAPMAKGRTAILVHGYTSQGQDMLSMARVFVDVLGYHVLIPDLRAHGSSEGILIGFGWLDRKDMLRWIDRVLQQQGPDEQVVLYGVSMGAATVMMTAGEKLPKHVKAVIEDCGYTSVKAELSYQMGRMYHLPAFPLVEVASLVSKLRAGYFFGEASALGAVKKTRLPILFIHGEADDFVPYAMMDQLYQAAGGEKARYSVPGAGHGGAFAANRQAYVEAMQQFLAKYVTDTNPNL